MRKQKKQVAALRVPDVTKTQADSVKGSGGGVPGGPSLQVGGVPRRPIGRYGAGGILTGAPVSPVQTGGARQHAA